MSQRINQSLILVASFALFGGGASIAAQAANANPKFTDYPVTVLKGPKAPLRLEKRDLDFRTRYRNLYKSSLNFAGHYIVDTVGCGVGCVFLLKLDVKTGKPAEWDVTSGEDVTECAEDYRDAKGEVVDKGYYFKPNSRLFVVTGQMPGNECGARYYLETNGKMTLIKEIHLEKSH